MKFIRSDDSGDTISDMLDGLHSTFPGLFVHSPEGIILLNRDRSHRVALLSGGGAGHEPFGAGFVGENMLTGFVYGPIFDSPPVASIKTAIDNLAKWNQGGIVVLVLNTTSNRLAFGLAVERALKVGIRIETIYVGDDCSLVGTIPAENECISDRRPLAGTAFYFKILGGLSSGGASIDKIIWEAKLITSKTASISVCYSSFHFPGRKMPHYTLKKNLISIGCGMNGEEGGHYTMKFKSIDKLAKVLVDRVLPRCLIFDSGTVCVFINDLGALMKMETYLIANEVQKVLISRNINVARMYVGTTMTSLNTKGFHLSMINVTDNKSWIKLLDLETEAFAWPGRKLSRVNLKWPQREFISDVNDITDMTGRELNCIEAAVLKSCILASCDALIQHREELDYLCIGTQVELGREMATFADRTIKEMKHSSKFLLSLPNTFLKLSKLAEETMYTSAAGSIYGLLFIGAAKSSHKPWHDIWDNALTTLSTYSSAKIGHRSLIDSLLPACGVFRRVIARDGPQAWKVAFKAAVDAAEEACEETATMVSKSIKSPFYGQNVGAAEAGARAVVIILKAVYNELNKIEDGTNSNDMQQQ